MPNNGGNTTPAQRIEVMTWSMRWKPMRRLMRRTGKFGVVAGTVIFSDAIYFNTYKIV
jgi:hypothetical protein